MKKIEIIQTLKNSYPRDVRKQVVKSILSEEKRSTIPNYKIINQIFSYVLSELKWNMVNNTRQWDDTPLEVMEEVFPQIKSTQWYKEQILTVNQSIHVEIRD